MAERSKKPRRWPWILAAALLLLVGGPVAWRFRPLNDTENFVLGEWVAQWVGTGMDRLALSPNRRFELSSGLTGSWSGTDEVIHFKPDVSVLVYLRMSYIQGRPAELFRWRLSVYRGGPGLTSFPGDSFQDWRRPQRDATDL